VYGITDTGLLVVTSDARLTDQRTPLDTSAKVASANKDGTAAIPSMRTPGTGAQQAAAGNDDRFSDARSPSAGSVADASVSTTAAIAESKLALASDAAAGVASRRSLGTRATRRPGRLTLRSCLERTTPARRP